MERVPTGPDPFFRVGPAELGKAQYFAVRRGEIDGRIDVNYWRLTPFVNRRLENSRFDVKPLGTLLSLVQYGCSSLAEEGQTGVPILRMNNLQDEGLDLSNLKYIELDERELATYRLVPGDILFNRTNSKELVGKCAVFQESGDWVFASYLVRVRTDQGRLLPQFASDFLGADIGRLQINRVSRQIIGMTNINAKEIRELRIPLPPIAEQEVLVSTMDTARAKRKAKLAEADALLAGLDDFLLETLGIETPLEDSRRVFAVGYQVVQQRLDPHFHAPEFAQVQKMFAQMKCEPLGSITAFSEETWRPKDRDQPTLRYIEIAQVDPKTGEACWNDVPTDEAPSRARMKVRADDIIVSLTRPHHGSIAHLSSEFEGCVASTGFAVIRDVSTHVQRDYLWCALRAWFCLSQMLQRASGGNYPAITKAELRNIVVPIPGLSTQHYIASEVTRRHEESRRLRAEAEANWMEAKQWFEEQLLGAGPP